MFFLSDMIRKYLQSAPLRKCFALFLRVPRIAARCKAHQSDFLKQPPVMANSFPKSGTHLLLQVLEPLPNIRNYGVFLASMPSITFRKRSRGSHLRLIKRIVPGELIPAHLFYDPDFDRELERINCAHYFIYRDPRDVVISEAHYLTSMNRWHRMHKYFESIESWDERISKSILGFNALDFPYNFPNIAERFSSYRGWLESASVFLVRYEDLVSFQRYQTIKNMALFYRDRCNQDFDLDHITREMIESINPEKSHTFRKGGSGNWCEAFSSEHKLQMKEIAGSLLIDLGYEKDLDW